MKDAYLADGAVLSHHHRFSFPQAAVIARPPANSMTNAEIRARLLAMLHPTVCIEGPVNHLSGDPTSDVEIEYRALMTA